MKKIVDTVLVFFIVEEPSGPQLLMIEKTSGQGAGKWNVPGGKAEPGETPEQTATRELFEETGIQLHGSGGPSSWESRGELLFEFEDTRRDWNNRCQILLRKASGRRPKTLVESDEGKVFWIPIENIPFEKMWAADSHWIPMVLAGHSVHGHFVFKPDHSVRIVSLNMV
jgi:8-oxo-dGTP diphosphatase